MDILLIDPPYKVLRGHATECAYGLGLAYLAAYLQSSGFSVAIACPDTFMDLPQLSLLDYDIRKSAEGQKQYRMILQDDNHFIWKSIFAVVRKNRPRAVGIAYFTPFKHAAEKIAGIVKEVDKRIKVIVGGHHPTYCPEETLENKNIDFVVRGEGETPLLSLMKELKRKNPDFSRIKGIGWRKAQGGIVVNPDADLLPDLDSLPYPARDAVLNIDYNTYTVHRLSTARGCPYNCAFCSDKKLWRGKVRRRSVDNVIEEIRRIKERFPNLARLEITDATFTYDRQYVKRLCQRLMEENLGVIWGCMARYDHLDPEIISVMKKGGCRALYVGLESGSQATLSILNKDIDVSSIIEKSQMVTRAGLSLVVAIILGVPGETREDMRKTLEIMRHLKADIFDVNTYVPLPGTQLYEGLTDEQRKGIDWTRTSMKSLDCHFNHAVSPKEFRKAILEAYEIAEKAKKRAAMKLFLKDWIDKNVHSAYQAYSD
jgi:radical SAM superfamily enzyme YgiQ (UPF0313 family)